MSLSQLELTKQISDVLPQTHCTRCGYSGCEPYAHALANNKAEINQCPPGGDKTIQSLAALLNKVVKPLNPKFGEYQPPHVALIVEQDCIGCAKCLTACPVDAILGASKMMHTIISEECTGCDLCIPPCPVDCIVIEVTDNVYNKTLAKQRYQAKQHRLLVLQNEKKERANQKKAALKAMMQAKKVRAEN
ncbi:MAG: RnfABCDGE type electron transport complex subunit B [Methylococcales bacterium]|nr:RnfABCDGE type electron transport complex subunit B [Methylococcales bacterium]